MHLNEEKRFPASIAARVRRTRDDHDEDESKVTEVPGNDALIKMTRRKVAESPKSPKSLSHSLHSLHHLIYYLQLLYTLIHGSHTTHRGSEAYHGERISAAIAGKGFCKQEAKVSKVFEYALFAPSILLCKVPKLTVYLP